MHPAACHARIRLTVRSRPARRLRNSGLRCAAQSHTDTPPGRCRSPRSPRPGPMQIRHGGALPQPLPLIQSSSPRTTFAEPEETITTRPSRICERLRRGAMPSGAPPAPIGTPPCARTASPSSSPGCRRPSHTRHVRSQSRPSAETARRPRDIRKGAAGGRTAGAASFLDPAPGARCVPGPCGRSVPGYGRCANSSSTPRPIGTRAGWRFRRSRARALRSAGRRAPAGLEALGTS